MDEDLLAGSSIDVAFSVRDIPFSYQGSWFCLSPVITQATEADDLHLVSHRNGMHAVLRLVPEWQGARVPAEVTANPAVLTWTAERGQVAAAYESPSALRLSGRGLGLRVTAAAATLTPFSGTYFFGDPVTSSHVFTSYETGHRYRVTCLAGALRGIGSAALGAAERAVVVDGDEWEIVIEEMTTAAPPFSSRRRFPEVVAAARHAVEEFTDRLAPWRGDRTPAAALACYVLWSATVAPAGFVRRPAVLMSKHWMDKIWSWDHCFNALALASGAPELAWDQLQVVFDHQTEEGALPDSITHAEVLHNFVKPPIHGWAVSRLRERLPGGLPDPALLYRQLAAWTTFWLDHRRAPGQPFPHYEHGNDSGWDNATVFDHGRPVQSPDLAAFLVLQMSELSRLAQSIGDRDAAARWRHEAGTMRAALLADLWDGTRFTSRAVAGTPRTTASLLDLMPIVLGEHLPAPVHTATAADIAGHLTAVGLATERTDSPHYEADGYWRGPVWAPTTVLIEDGLRRGGAVDLADQVSARFRAACEKSGFAENFDALTGQGLRDRAYTWTASAYLLLAADAQRRLLP